MPSFVHARRTAGVLFTALALFALCAATVLFAAGPAAAASPSVSISPSSGLTSGQKVTVSTSGFRANFTPLVIVECAETATGESGCDTDDVAFGTTDRSGSYSTSLTVRSKFRSTDCTKVACIVQAHEGTSPTSGSTATSAPLRFGGAAKANANKDVPKQTAPKRIGTTPAATANRTSSDPPGAALRPGAANGGGVRAAQPTGADTGHGVSTSPPLLSEVGVLLAALLLAAGLIAHRRRTHARS